MREYSKKVKKLIREFAAEAHERELHRELTRLDRRFAEWRAGRLGSGELSNEIHQYETGPSRELFKRYPAPWHPPAPAGGGKRFHATSTTSVARKQFREVALCVGASGSCRTGLH